MSIPNFRVTTEGYLEAFHPDAGEAGGWMSVVFPISMVAGYPVGLIDSQYQGIIDSISNAASAKEGFLLNTVLVMAGTPYEVVIPTGTKSYSMRLMGNTITAETEVFYSFESTASNPNAPVYPFEPRVEEFETGINLVADKIIYFVSNTDNVSVAVKYWI